MWDLIVSIPDHCLSFYFRPERLIVLSAHAFASNYLNDR